MSDDRDFEQQLHQAAAEAAQRSQLRSAADIRRRAGRRRAAQVSAAGVATVLVVAGVWAVAAPGSDDAGVGPADPSQRTSASPEPTEATRTNDGGQPTEATAATEATDATQATDATDDSEQTPQWDWVTTLPDDMRLVLPHWGQKSQFEEESDWGPIQDSDTWLMVPCEGEDGYPSDGARTAHRGILQTGIEHLEAEQIAVYPSDAEAIAAMDELRHALVDCAETTIQGELDATYRESFWDFRNALDVTSASGLAPNEAFQAWNWNRTYDLQNNPVYGLGGGFFTVSRVGNAILLTMSDGETDWAAPGAVDEVSSPQAETTRTVLPNLCDRYSGPDGC
jgi:hypothetical protein